MRRRLLLVLTVVLVAAGGACGGNDGAEERPGAGDGSAGDSGSVAIVDDAEAPADCAELGRRICERARTCANESGTYVVAFRRLASVMYDGDGTCLHTPPINRENCKQEGRSAVEGCWTDLARAQCSDNTLTVSQDCVFDGG